VIDLHAICDALPRMSGDAAKLALLLATVGADELRCDAEWIRDAAAAAGSTPAIVRNALSELRAIPLVSASGRNLLTRLDLRSQSADVGSAGRGTRRRAKRVDEGVGSGSEERHSLSTGASSEGRDTIESVEAGERSESPERSEVLDSTAASRPAESDANANPMRFVIGAFIDGFARANHGARPTIDGKAVGLMKQLVDRHGAEEVARRIGIMFDDPPPWPPPPYDVDTLRFRFDRFATPGSRVRKRGAVVDRAPQDARAYYGEVDVPGWEGWNDRDDLGVSK